METLTTATQSEEENQQLEEQQEIQNELHLHSHNHQTVQCSSSSSSADTNTNTIPLSIHLSVTDTETNTEIVMKKKKRLNNSGSNGHHNHHHNGVVLASLMYHFRRKRRLHRHLFPLLSVISGCFLLLFAAFSLPLHSVLFLSLSLSIYRRRRCGFSFRSLLCIYVFLCLWAQVNNAVELRSGSDSDPFPAFSVPVRVLESVVFQIFGFSVSVFLISDSVFL